MMNTKKIAIIQFVAAGIFLLLGLLYMGEEILNDFAYVGFAGAFGFGSNALYLLNKSKAEEK